MSKDRQAGTNRVRIEVPTNTYITSFATGAISNTETLIENGMLEKYPEGNIYITERPPISITDDVSDNIAFTKGRGIYYWEDATDTYSVNDTTVYKGGSAGTALGTTITTGTHKIEFFALSTYMILVDAEADKAYTINSGVDFTTMTEIGDSDFPPKQGTPVGLAHGGAILNGRFYVLGENGKIYGSDSLNPIAWTATNVIEAEREADGGVYLTKHYDQLVAFGPKTIEFFYDAGNATGSPLSRRDDIMFNVGCADGHTPYVINDVIYFVGADRAGSLGVYKIDKFQLQKISDTTMDAFLTQTKIGDSLNLMGAGMSFGSHVFYILTTHDITGGNIDPKETLVYDNTYGAWYVWKTTAIDHTKFAVVDFTERTTETIVAGQGILHNGDIFQITTNLSTADADGTNSTNISMVTRFAPTTLGTHRTKFASNLEYVGNYPTATQTLTVKWSDEDQSNYSAGRSLELKDKRKLRRLGDFNRRSFETTYAGSAAIRFEGLELDIEEGDK